MSKGQVWFHITDLIGSLLGCRCFQRMKDDSCNFGMSWLEKQHFYHTVLVRLRRIHQWHRLSLVFSSFTRQTFFCETQNGMFQSFPFNESRRRLILPLVNCIYDTYRLLLFVLFGIWHINRCRLSVCGKQKLLTSPVVFIGKTKIMHGRHQRMSKWTNNDS